MSETLTPVERCYQYCEKVESKEIVTNKWIKLAVKRFRKDLKKSESEDYPYYFDEESANRFCQFCELLKQYKDRFAGVPLILQPWQCFIFCNIYGWLDKRTKERRFRKAFIFVARKNGKTTMMGATLLWDLLSTNGAEGYAAATKRDQARILFDSVREMVRQNPILSSKIKTYNSTSRLVNLKKAGKIEALSADSDSMDGLNPSCVVVDELSAQKNFDTIKILQSGQGSRPSPLLLEITSGSDDLTSAGKQEFDRSCQILQNVFEDDSYFCVLYTLDEKDDWKNERVWIKANPNLDISVNRDFLKKACLEAQQQPALESEFRCKNLGQWLTNSKAWIPANTWEKCVDNAKKYRLNKSESYFAVLGVDLSKRIDLTSLTLTVYQKGKYYLTNYLYFPEDSMSERIKKESELWRKWVEEGYITATAGSTVDYAYLHKDIRKIAEEYQIEEILFDPYNSCSLINELEQDFNMVEVAQNLKNMSPLSKAFEEEVRKGNVVSDNPVMKWMINNATIWQDPNGNIKVEKLDEKKENRRIDGVITSIMGVGRIRQLLDDGEIDTRTPEQIREDTEKLLALIDY
jgi:phage terminase large subunit-like protein